MDDCGNKILVMGVGNPLMRDEGIGPRVVELLLSTYEFPEDVEVADAGTMGYSILDMFREIDHLIVVDAVRDSGHPPGTVLVLQPEDLADNQVMHSLHDVRLVDVLEAAALVGHAPQTVCVGVQIESIEEWVLELSEPCEAALPLAAGAVLDQLAHLGHTPMVRDARVDVHSRIIEAMPEESLAPQTDE